VELSKVECRAKGQTWEASSSLVWPPHSNSLGLGQRWCWVWVINKSDHLSPGGHRGHLCHVVEAASFSPPRWGLWAHGTWQIVRHWASLMR
jgi:hypothetical protein